jgi:AcrR family transcriptional regulator
MPASISERIAHLKRQHILAAAVGVFADHGFRGATIRMVAQAAGVSDGTIYNSFENKTALLLATLDPQDDQASPPTGAFDPNDAEAVIRFMFCARWAGFTPENLVMQKAIFSEVLINDELRALYFARVIGPVLDLPEPIFANLAGANKIKPVDAALVLRSIAAIMLGFVTLRLLGDEKTIEDWENIPHLLADLFICGLVKS